MIQNHTIGIITILYKSDEVIEGFIRSVANQDYKNFKLYFLDNNPNITTAQLIDRLLDKYELKHKSNYIPNKENIGYSKANNLGIQMAINDNCEYILLSNNDIEFFQNDIFASCIESAGVNLMVSPKILYSEPKDIIWYAGGHINSFTALAKVYGGNKKDSAVYSKDKLVDFAPGCFLFINKSIFEQIGFFDENFFVYFEDADFCLRCNKLGYKVLVLANKQIYHKVSFSSGGAHSKLYVKLMAEGRLYFIYKNFNGIFFLTAFFTAILIILMRFITYDNVRRKVLIEGSILSLKKIINTKN